MAKCVRCHKEVDVWDMITIPTADGQKIYCTSCHNEKL
jgi:DNA-directed RNA polymerase subunit RPC12/RpoP